LNRFGLFENDEFNLLGEIPSIVEFTNDGRCLMGSSLTAEPSDYKNIITNFKRIIGLRHIDRAIKNNRDYLPYSIIDQNNEPTIRLLIENKIKLVTFESILTRLLNKVKQISESKLNKQVTHAIVSIPSIFNNNQRLAIKNSIDRSNLKFSGFLNELTALSIAYVYVNNIKEFKRLLVINLGDFHFEISLIEVDEIIFEQKAVKGYANLGGQDFTNNLLDHCIQVFKEKTGVNLRTERDKTAIQLLRKHVQQAKHILSFESQAHIKIESLFKNFDFDLILTSYNVHQLNMDLFQRTKNLILTFLKENHIVDYIIIDEIILTGGSSQIPQLNTNIRKIFDGKKIVNFFDSNNVVLGIAAAHAFKKASHEVTAYPFGIEAKNGFNEIIKKNSLIPNENFKDFSLRIGFKPASEPLKLYEGDYFLRDFYLNNTLKDLKITKKLNIRLRFKIDRDGFLNENSSFIIEDLSDQLQPLKNNLKFDYSHFLKLTSWIYYKIVEIPFFIRTILVGIILIFFIGFVCNYINKIKIQREFEARIENERRIQHTQEMQRMEGINRSLQLLTAYIRAIVFIRINIFNFNILFLIFIFVESKSNF